jgi:hypothetical protein
MILVGIAVHILKYMPDSGIGKTMSGNPFFPIALLVFNSTGLVMLCQPEKYAHGEKIATPLALVEIPDGPGAE